MINPSRQEYLKRSRHEKLIPVWDEVLVDMETPISIYRKVCRESPSYLLESVEGGENIARYSFIGLDPWLTFSAKNGSISIVKGKKSYRTHGNPFDKLQQIVESFAVTDHPGLPRFFGGAVGYFGYDMVRYLEPLPYRARDDLYLPDCYFVMTRLVLIYDHVRCRLKIVFLSEPTDSPEKDYEEACRRVEQVKERLEGSGGLASLSLRESPGTGGEDIFYRSNCSRREFTEKVMQAKEYIRAGDIFQVVLSQRLDTPYQGSIFDLYRSLRAINPSPYMFFLNFENLQLVGASPEMLVRVEKGIVQTRPIAGTRPRGKNELEDEELARELKADEKERAEHLMLVDLGRNDVGRVSRYGTVTVPDFMEVEKYSHVMHLVSTVQGELAEDKTPLDALKACFPAGTVSGAPKVRAMEIIEELEPTRRGPYAGGIGYLGLNGNLDFCITIRTVLLHQGRAYVQAGAGIVADSEPEREYQETLNKARALLAALRQAGGEPVAVGDR
ncbi:anthranilate synthase component I [Calderihabitans maritimus]|uniref:Anthranilate synthase component 1 n=1 Tax=Calderihabitans maritimus TaxID=1246530 RepID=A0A1Z5HNA3_9FIRM|nr:anthranilate synthase component I [Calderihabitans maritimus]GAW90994.1 anthranilate synthase component I [Calderihabitans maritimus]